jgi:Tfp pilus assembly protein PilP
MKRLFLLIVLLTVSGCTNQEEIEVQNKNETQSNSASTPAASIKNIKNNVQGTLDQIKARDEYQQELAN